MCNILSTGCIYKIVLKPRFNYVVTSYKISRLCYGHSAALHSQSSHHTTKVAVLKYVILIEKASIQLVQIPHTYTTVMYLLHSDLMVMHRNSDSQYRQSPHNLSYSFHTDSKFHTAKAATMQFLAPQQDWRQDSVSKLRTIVLIVK